LWHDLKNETVDYGIMENAEKVAVLPAGGLGWSDVGMWSSLFEVLLPDMNGNVATNTAICILRTKRTTRWSMAGTARPLIVTIGVDDMVVVDGGRCAVGLQNGSVAKGQGCC
jgi:mannose-1-phosphate guanylyltransferase